jgi:hypothetical protein
MTFHRDDQVADFHAGPAGKPGRATGEWEVDGEAARSVVAPGGKLEANPMREPVDHEWSTSAGLMRRYNG